MENRVRNSKNEPGGKGPFAVLSRWLKLEGVLVDTLPARFTPYALFITVMGIIYIGNRHFSDRTIRKIDNMEAEVEDLRADFTTLKSEYMFASKQSEVARKVKKVGFQETRIPHYKIVVNEDEYKRRID
ncbi:MAG: FtsL-like putative cell division protein [Imperialibacter sp.]